MLNVGSAGVSALGCLYLMTNLSVETWLRFLAWLVLGLAVYLGYGRRNSRMAEAQPSAATSRSPSGQGP